MYSEECPSLLTPHVEMWISSNGSAYGLEGWQPLGVPAAPASMLLSWLCFPCLGLGKTPMFFSYLSASH